MAERPDVTLRVVAICGPTGGGKTALSLPLAERFAGEIVCCDSMQVYRGMDIGTAKATTEERARVPHHLLDVLSPAEEFSAAQYAETARATAAEIARRGALPILVGGTGLYLDAFRTGAPAAPVGQDAALRAELADYATAHGTAALHALLAQADPESAAAIHPNNLPRVIRALEIYRLAGVPKSVLDRQRQGMEVPVLPLFLTFRDRELLYRRIEERVEQMLQAGLLEEARRIYALPSLSRTARNAIGYKELFAAFAGDCTLEDAVAEIKQATRRYAKRQMTWFAHHRTFPLYADEGGQMRSAAAVLEEASALTERFLRTGEVPETCA